MSTDIRLAWLCPHKVQQVPLTPQDDEGVVWLAPIPMLGNTTLTVNDQEVPPGGLWGPAEITSAQQSLYRFTRPATLTIQSTEATEQLSFAAGDLTTEQLRQRFLAIKGVRFSRTESDGFSLRESSALGPRSTIRLSGSALGPLGFVQIGAQGRQLYPSWAVLRNPQTRVPNLIGFSDTTQVNWVPRISTQTQEPYCARCQGSGVENDYRFDQSGNVKMVRSFDLLYQICLKAILTEVGSNPYFQSYGSNVMSAIGQKALVGVEFSIRDSVRRSLSIVQDMQRQQQQSQIVTAEERLSKILSIDVNRVPNDPTTVSVEVSVQSASRKQVDLQVFFSVPGATTRTQIPPVA